MADGWMDATGVPAWARDAVYDGRVDAVQFLEPAALDGAWTLLDDRNEVEWRVTPVRLTAGEDGEGATFGVVVTRNGRPDAASETRHGVLESLRAYGGHELGNRATRLPPAERAAYEACMLLAGVLREPVTRVLGAALAVREAGYAAGTHAAFQPGDVEHRLLLLRALALAEVWVDYHRNGGRP